VSGLEGMHGVKGGPPRQLVGPSFREARSSLQYQEYDSSRPMTASLPTMSNLHSSTHTPQGTRHGEKGARVAWRGHTPR
jgi:hypothetical protein